MGTSVQWISPIIQRLNEQYAVGESENPAHFWQELLERGVPLIEPIAGDDRHVLVTFLWRTQEETRNVVIVGNVVGWDIAKNQMTRLANTDLWYKTYYLRSDLRATYLFSPNDTLAPWPLVEGARKHALLRRQLACLPDPLNPRQVALIPDIMPDYLSSVLELPHAPDESILQVRESILHGEVTEHLLESTILKQNRRVWLYTPGNYAVRSEHFHLLILLDGNAYLRSMSTPVLLDNLIADHKIQPLVTAFVDNPSETRSSDLLNSKSFLAFLSQELLPWIRETYRVTTDPMKTIIGGSSAGGLAATHAAFDRPDCFGQVLSQSGAFWWDWDEEKHTSRNEIIREFILHPCKPIRFYLEVGYLEHSSGVNVLQSNRHMRDVLEAKGYEVHYAEVGGDHEWISWRVTLGNGLITLAGEETAPDPGNNCRMS